MPQVHNLPVRDTSACSRLFELNPSNLVKVLNVFSFLSDLKKNIKPYRVFNFEKTYFILYVFLKFYILK